MSKRLFTQSLRDALRDSSVSHYHISKVTGIAQGNLSRLVHGNISRYSCATQNMRTTFEKIIRRAGLTPWPKLFQNLRASRATELAELCPGHVAAAWLGHSEAIANKHYRQTTDEHFARAAGALHPALQQGAQLSAAEGSDGVVTPDYCREMHSIASLARMRVGGGGLEPTTSTV